MSKKVFNKLVILTLIISVFLTPLLNFLFRIDVQIITFLIFGILLIFYFILFPKMHLTDFDKIPFQIAIFSIIFYFISQFFWFGSHNVYSYIGIPVAFIAYLIDFNTLIKYLKYILFISLIIAFYEYVSRSYFFTNTIQRGGEEISLDMRLFSGAANLMRAKGLFYGPLSLAHFAFGFAVLYNKNIKIILVTLLIAFLSSVRLSLISISAIVVFFMFLSDSFSFKRKFKVALGISLLILVVISLGQEFLYASNIERIFTAFNMNDPGNQARLMFFFNGFKTWSSYNLENILLGNNSFYYSIYRNNPESGWITLLTDNGILGVLFYLFPFIFCIHKFFIKRDFYELSLMILLFMFLGIVTFHLSATSNFILWIVLFEKINLAKYNTNKYNESIAYR